MLINNAALDSVPGKLKRNIDDEIFKSFNVGVLGAVNLIEAFSKDMKKKKHGSIINIGSDLSLIAPNQRLYKGLFKKFPLPNFAVALQNDAGMPAGQVGICPGNALAGVDSVDLTIRGVSGHGGYPSTTKDPVVLAAQTVLSLQTIVSREVPAIQPAVVTVGSIHGGTKHSIIPEEVKLQLTVRYYDDSTQKIILNGIQRISEGIARAAGVPLERNPIMNILDSTPPTYNDPALSRLASQAMAEILGQDNVLSLSPVMGGEDFGLYRRTPEKIPLCMFWLGAVSPDKFKESRKQKGKPLPSLHSSIYAPAPELTIKTGVKSLTAIAIKLLNAKSY